MRKILINFGLISFLSILIAFGTLWYLNIYTNHDSVLIEVADLSGLAADDALNLLAEADLEGEVTDTVYKDGVEKLSVINQNPIAGMKVKPGRKVYLVININTIPMVKVPDLANKTSLSQARNILIRKHLKIGKITEQISLSVRTENDQPVLAQYYPGTTNPIKPETEVERNSEIDLVVGVYGFGDSDSMHVQDFVDSDIEKED
ncbi:MAG: PASTA domain-containing protein [Bacteroidia bacterium]|nr:PASTA domain-containing protein [Bacteroidia bacterium]MDG2042086.1 PASTA domain-containing protein [Bacteroidia bacterium]